MTRPTRVPRSQHGFRARRPTIGQMAVGQSCANAQLIGQSFAASFGLIGHFSSANFRRTPRSMRWNQRDTRD